MEEKIKEIVAVFTRIPADQISTATLVDRSAVTSSIMLHRMYAKLSEAGIIVDNYQEVKTFGNLLQRVGGNKISTTQEMDFIPVSGKGQMHAQINGNSESMPMNIGIDVEEISAMPRVSDLREDDFYKMNFSPTEIAYCILKPDPYASLAGLFAAKEAIVKADNQYRSKPFSNIIIDHLPDGKPIHDKFHLSISHTNNTAVAVAVRIESGLSGAQSHISVPPAKDRSSSFLVLVLISIILSAIALFIALKQ